MNRDQVLSDGSQLMGGNYTVEQQLSSGGFGNTYVVRNRLDKVFAMKEFFIKGVNLRTDGMVTVSVPDNKATFESQRTKFEKEAKRLSKINNPHIVKVHDLFYENGTVYYTMDYIDGESLADRMKRTGKSLSEKEVTNILYQVLDALSCVHSQYPPLLHLDLKPANIMVDKQGNAYLIDFGSSKQIDSEGNETFSTSTGFTYTQGYAPVELMMGVKENIGPWTDFYALGATLYNLLSGKSPKDINVHDGEDGFDFPDGLSPKMRQLIVWLMNPNRKKRPQTVKEILTLLDENKEEHADEKRMVVESDPYGEDEETSFVTNVEEGLSQESYSELTDTDDNTFSWKWIAAGVVAIIFIPLIYFVMHGVSDEDVMTPEEMYLRGNSYYNGEGVEQDYTEAVNWYRKAAEQGNTDAQNWLGECYYYGNGVTKDYTEAVNWYRKAAEQGNAEAQKNLGVCYNNGEGVWPDQAEAANWYHKAAEQGLSEAQFYLGGCYEEGSGVSQNNNEAFNWYLKAAEQGHVKAQYNIGCFYENGYGVKRNRKEAFNWYRKAAEQGSASGQNALGLCYDEGIGVSQDDVEAVKWYRKAADQGHATAKYNLGLCYYYGEGVSRDVSEAAKWLKESAEQGSEEAKKFLKENNIK